MCCLTLFSPIIIMNSKIREQTSRFECSKLSILPSSKWSGKQWIGLPDKERNSILLRHCVSRALLNHRHLGSRNLCCHEWSIAWLNRWTNGRTDRWMDAMDQTSNDHISSPMQIKKSARDTRCKTTAMSPYPLRKRMQGNRNLQFSHQNQLESWGKLNISC